MLAHAAGSVHDDNLAGSTAGSRSRALRLTTYDDWACGSARARPRDHRWGTRQASATRTTRTCRRRPARTRRRAASSRRSSARPLAPVGGRLSLPARMISDGSDPTWRGGKVLHPMLHGVVHPPTRRAAPAAKKGGVAPVFPRSAGAARVGRSRTKNPNRNSGNWKGGVLHPPPRFVLHPPLCRCHISRGPHRDPRRDPGTVQRLGQTRAGHLAASGLINRLVLQVT